MNNRPGFQTVFFNVTCVLEQAPYIKILSSTSVTYSTVVISILLYRLKLCVFLNYYFDKLTELKAEAWEKEKELRQKINHMQKEQAERIENLQVNNFVYMSHCLTGFITFNYLGRGREKSFFKYSLGCLDLKYPAFELSL